MAELMINIWAVLVAALAQFAIGFVWYGPLFGKTWMKLMGITPKSMKSMKMSPTVSMIFGLITAVIMSYVTAHFVDFLDVTTFATVWQFTFWLWLGYIATIQLGVVLWENKSFKLFVLNAAYWLVSLFAITWINAAWV